MYISIHTSCDRVNNIHVKVFEMWCCESTTEKFEKTACENQILRIFDKTSRNMLIRHSFTQLARRKKKRPNEMVCISDTFLEILDYLNHVLLLTSICISFFPFSLFSNVVKVLRTFHLHIPICEFD